MPFWSLMLLAALGLFAGANLAFQALLNAHLRLTYLGSPLRASLVSYIGGLLCCVVALLATRESLNVWHPALRSHWWLWTGGLYGLVYLAIVIWLIPRLGSAAVFGLVVAGQMIAALAFDQIGLFGVAAQSVDAPKILGALLLITGAVLIRQ